ncbi:hypothetical protein A6R68_13270, partial [Neotoma lepida]
MDYGIFRILLGWLWEPELHYMSVTLGNFTFDVIPKTYSYLTPTWKETVFTKSPYQEFTDHPVKTHTESGSEDPGSSYGHHIGSSSSHELLSVPSHLAVEGEKILEFLWKLHWKQFWYKRVERLLLLVVNHDNDPLTARCAQIICGQK